MRIKALLLSLVIIIVLVGACTVPVTTPPAETTTITATTTVTTATHTTVTTTATETITTTVILTQPEETTPEPTSANVQLISETDCGENQNCYHVKIEYADLAPREAQIRATHLDNANGAIIFAGGGLGKNWYGDGSSTAQIVSTMWEHGLETYEIKWIGDQGWATDCYGEGFKKATGAFSEVVRWITTDLATNPEYIAITGNSGGSWVTAYGLAIHNLEEVLDTVVLTSGPVFSDLVGACCTYTKPIRGGIIDYIMGWADNGDYCQSGNCPDWLTQALQMESIVSPIPEEIRDYDYPNTKVVFIEGETDDAAVNQGAIFYDAIISEKVWIILPGVGHGVPGSDEGAVMIQEALLDGFEASN